MHSTKLLLAAISGTLALACTGPALAAPFGVYQVAIGVRYSDSNMRWANARIEQNIDMLQHDRHDYDGRRADAVELLSAARTQIGLGLEFDGGREDVPPPFGFVRPDNDMRYLRGDGASDENIVVVRHNLEDIVEVLERDNHDYGGHRADAVSLIDRARHQLDLALRDDSSR